MRSHAISIGRSSSFSRRPRSEVPDESRPELRAEPLLHRSFDRGVTLVDLCVGERACLVGVRGGEGISVDDVERERAVIDGYRATAEEIEDRDVFDEIASDLGDRLLDVTG